MAFITVQLNVSAQWLRDRSTIVYFEEIPKITEEDKDIPELIRLGKDEANKSKLYQAVAFDFDDHLLSDTKFHGALLPLAYSKAPQNKHNLHMSFITAVHIGDNHELLSIPREALNTEDAVKMYFMIEPKPEDALITEVDTNEEIDLDVAFMTKYGSREGLLFDSLPAHDRFCELYSSIGSFKASDRFKTETILLSNTNYEQSTKQEILNQRMRGVACIDLYKSRALNSPLRSPFDDSKWQALIFPADISPALIKKTLPRTWSNHCKLAAGQPVEKVRALEGGKELKVQQNTPNPLYQLANAFSSLWHKTTTKQPVAPNHEEQSLLSRK